jgi:anthranilate/para-aminobenzoate synthase component II
MKRLKADKSIADTVTHQELQEELSRLREAVALLANCVGAHIISQASGARLMKLLAPLRGKL